MMHHKIMDKNMANARIRHQKIKKAFPKYADKAQSIIINYLKKYDPECLAVYLGYADDYMGGAKDRFYLYWLQKDLCGYLRGLEKYNGPYEHIRDHKIRWDHHIRKWLFLPLRIVEDDTIEEIEALLKG